MFPEELAVAGAAATLEACGRRAHAAARDDDAIVVRIDGLDATIRISRPPPRENPSVWPFGAATGQELLFAASDQPIVVYELRAPGDAQLLADHDPDLVVTVEPVGAGVRATVHRAGGAAPDAAALIASSIARARRRAARRPSVSVADVPDPIPALEHALRLAVARAATLDVHARVAGALALLALNDADAALHLLRDAGGAFERDWSAALIAAGAWAAWRGEVIPLDAARSAAREGSADGEWAGLARALAPFAADVVERTHAERSTHAGDPAAALASAGRALPEAAAVLELMHARLGVMPDAVRARVRLAPRLEQGHTVLDRLAAGDALFRLEAEVDAERASLVIEQVHGPTPYRAIVEPRLPAGHLRRAYVDDSPAELDSALVGGALQVGVQLVVDQRRHLVLDYDRR